MTHRQLAFLSRLLLAAIFFPANLSALAAQDALSSRERERDRLEFNDYFEREILKRKAAPEAAGKCWSLEAETFYGYESNPFLEGLRKNDSFHEESVLAEVGFAPFGFRGRFYNRDYLDFSGIDETYFETNPYLTLDLGAGLELEEEYRFGYDRYAHDETLSRRGHAVRSTLRHRTAPAVTQHVFYEFEYSDYLKNEEVPSRFSFLRTGRDEEYHETGYGVDWEVTGRTMIGVEASYQWNSAEGITSVFSDYEAARVAGYLYSRLPGSWACLVTGGYEFTDYKGTTLRGLKNPAEDDYFYGEAELTYSFAEGAQLVISYRYEENSSNLAPQNYVNWSLKTGIRVKM